MKETGYKVIYDYYCENEHFSIFKEDCNKTKILIVCFRTIVPC